MAREQKQKSIVSGSWPPPGSSTPGVSSDDGDSPPAQDALPLGFAVAAGALTLLIAGPMFLAAIGVIEVEEPMGWGLRLLLGSFTGIFVVVGSLLFFAGIYASVNAAVPGRAPWILRFLIMLLKRVTWGGLLSAVMYGLLAAEFWALLHLPDRPFGIGGAIFNEWTTLEFISIHATAFLGTVLTLPLGGKYNKIRFGVFAALLLLYAVMVLAILDPLPAVFFLYLVSAKFHDYFFRTASPEELASLMMRWVLMFMLFVIITWGQAFEHGPETFDIAIRYFGVLAVLELFALTEIPIPGSSKKITAPKKEKAGRWSLS